MKTPRESEIDDLYRGPLDEFTTARNMLAKSLSGSDKKTIGSLVKPSLPMWVINQLYWRDSPTYKALIDASEKLRSAHLAALTANGRTVDTRKFDHLHQTTVEKAFAKATGMAEKSGLKLTDSVREAIRRTLAALPGAEPAGRLTREPAPVGFSLLSGVKPQPVDPTVVRSKAEAAKQQKEAERQARREEERARREEEKREREIKKAEQALREAQRRLASLKG